MVRAEDKEIRCIPLHTLCKNEKLGEQSAIDILTLLISAYPESVEKKVGDGTCSWFMAREIEGKDSIQIAEEHGASIGFLKALLFELARQSSIPKTNVLQIAC